MIDGKQAKYIENEIRPRLLFRFQLYYYSDNAAHGKKETVLIIDTRERVERQYEEVDDLDDT